MTDSGDEAAAVEPAAVSLLRVREHSRHELRRKLLARRHPEATVDQVLDDLERAGLLSDERFAEVYIAQRARKGYGPVRIRAELAERGVADDVIGRWLGPLRDDWPERLEAVANARFAGPVNDRGDLARRGRFLQQRGFPLDLVRRYLDRVTGG